MLLHYLLFVLGFLGFGDQRLNEFSLKVEMEAAMLDPK